jgi:hypothetical protein
MGVFIRRSSPILRSVEALVARLSKLDTDTEGALRVVTFYDTLVRRRVDLPALARASAGLAECSVGIGLHGSDRVIRMSPCGTRTRGPQPPASTMVVVTLDDEDIGTVWLERPGPAGPLDRLVLDRLSIAVAAVVERYGPAHTTMADPALVELVISPDTDDAARDRAMRLLGFAPDLPVRVVAVHSQHPLDKVGSSICPSRTVKAAQLADVGVILAATADLAGLPAGVRAGVGAAGTPPRSWREARTALRFTTGREPVVTYADLGVAALLAQVPADELRANADVAAIAELAYIPTDLDTLDAFCVTGSLRRAADVLHLHHSSVARRLEQLGKRLGIELTDPSGLARARLALKGWHLLED